MVGTFSLIPQVRDAVSIPVIAAGGMADRRGVVAAMASGANGAQVGTGFLATTESGASDVHKAALPGEEAEATVLTRLSSGRHPRAIPNRLIRELAAAEPDVAPHPWQGHLMMPIRRAAGCEGRSDYVDLWSGQGAPLVRARSAASFVGAAGRPVVDAGDGARGIRPRRLAPGSGPRTSRLACPGMPARRPMAHGASHAERSRAV